MLSRPFFRAHTSRNCTVHGPEIGRQMTSCNYMPTVHFRVIWRKYEEKKKYWVFMRILNLFLDFRSDVRFRRNDDFKITRFLKVVCVCLTIGRQMTYCDCTPTVNFRVIWQKMKKIQNIEFSWGFWICFWIFDRMYGSDAMTVLR